MQQVAVRHAPTREAPPGNRLMNRHDVFRPLLRLVREQTEIILPLDTFGGSWYSYLT